MPDDLTPAAIDAFIQRWERSGGHERGAGQQFLLEFCDLLGLDKPDPPGPENELNTYTFERRVDRRKPDGTTTPNWIDLFRSLHFVLETKQGVNPRRDKSDPDQPLLPALDAAPAAPSAGHGQRGSTTWDKALDRAHAQGERYIHLLPPGEPRPPFLIVCDVGHCFDLYAEFSGTGGQYEAFPDPRSRRIELKDLHRPEIRDLFQAIWTDPHSLDPSKHAAKVTREVARALADLARSLEKDGHDPQHTAGFLQRCLFTMFAEDVGLLPEDAFLGMLERVREQPAGLVTMLQALWTDMATGSEFSVAIQHKIPHFNGGLFKETSALPLRPDQIAYLIHAARQDWSAVEPAIFGTLLERALDPRERHKLGAHYTPRSYVERLVRPTLIEPLRAEWETVKVTAAQLDEQGKTPKAREAVETFHHKLARTRVLDPACGSGNFLYVSLELLKRLEAEVLDLFEKLGGNRALEMDTVLIRPSNFLGIEINPRAAAIAQLVLWIGYFQWHKRTTGKADTNDRPLLPKHNSIECRDAVLAYDEKIPRRDPETGEVVTIWDGRTTKPHPVTGKEVPDESARIPLFDYTNPRRAEWPEADYIVGNPPFIGKHRMREALGDGYVEALRAAWQKHKPAAWDFVMFWWQHAAECLQDEEIERFGFITTNSISQTFNRRVTEPFLTHKKKPLHLSFAIPDHPWVDSADGADVRIAMTVAGLGAGSGWLEQVVREAKMEDGEIDVILERIEGIIAENLKLGANVSSAIPLTANSKLSCPGVKLHGSGFIVDHQTAIDLGHTVIDGLETWLRGYRNGRDLTSHPRDVRVIDLYGLTEEEARDQCPTLYQHVMTTVKPERDAKAHTKDGKGYAEKWWLFGKPRQELRVALSGLRRYIATVETSKHRFFVFLDQEILPDNKLIAIASDDPFNLGVLSSLIHVAWALQTGGRLGVGNDPVYVKTRCFETFPFPALDEGPLKQRIRDLGEKLDAHRKARQAAHPELTLTGLYNVLEKLRTGTSLTDKERKIHDQGLVTILKQIHDELDEAVLEAYGWQDFGRCDTPVAHAPVQPHDRSVVPPLADRLAAGDEAAQQLGQELLKRLVALNHERAEEEKRGLIRWLRPEYQSPDDTGVPASEQKQIELEAESASGKPITPSEKLKWPASMPDQVAAIQRLLPATGPDPSELAACFGKRTHARIRTITEILDTLTALGKL
ncbi:class I SAM-dependent DNA methyltransferase [Haloferula sp. A504]|uniref:class I SAM-dependent DNA methyltransferase n=1 Tax=Haloferula sp. A504 TaxID=3373601 RepID=UPI0031C061D4|nr:hypothetical protein [Verrucomicrobiaceae bacterium E54]